MFKLVFTDVPTFKLLYQHYILIKIFASINRLNKAKGLFKNIGSKKINKKAISY